MAGFFPHIGQSSAGAFTPLPTTSVTGILDSIVSDIGAGVNGWTLHDDQRTTGASYPWAVYLWHNGAYNNQTNYANGSWTFTNGSPYSWGNGSLGYNYAATITSGEPGNTGTVAPANWPQISVDNVNWYRAAYTNWTYPTVSATLDRNFAQATTFTYNLLCRIEKYIVLKCTSTTKTFYIVIGQIPGTTFLYVQPHEEWSNTTHSGFNGGQIEVCRGSYWDDRYSINATYTSTVEVQYVMCLYPEAMFFWIHEIYPYPIQTEPNNVIATAFYVGNLDTTGIKSADPDAVWFGCSDTSYTGLRCAGGVDHATTWVQWGSSQCLRTSNGNIWAPYNSYHAWGPKDNMYQFVPRGRPYTRYLGAAANIANDSNFSVLDVDIYQCGFNDGDNYSFGADICSEGRRGKVRYLKVPAFNPSGMGLAAFGPSQDGYTYLMVMCGFPFLGAAGVVDGSIGSLQWVDVNSNYVPSSFADSNGPVGAGSRSTTTYSDIVSAASVATSMYRYLMIPIM
jgi:hypothetical protein